MNVDENQQELLSNSSTNVPILVVVLWILHYAVNKTLNEILPSTKFCLQIYGYK